MSRVMGGPSMGGSPCLPPCLTITGGLMGRCAGGAPMLKVWGTLGCSHEGVTWAPPPPLSLAMGGPRMEYMPPPPCAPKRAGPHGLWWAVLGDTPSVGDGATHTRHP